MSFVVSSKKPFCKVCCDSGNDSNHWIKNDKGKVICPTLLSLLCRCCNKKGHTISYCPVSIKYKKREAFLVKNGGRVVVDKNINKKKNTIVNRFQALDSDSEDVEDMDEEEDVEEPESPIGPPPRFLKPTYASILCKEKKEEPVVVAIKEIEEPVCVKQLFRPILPAKRKLWSDYTSDDDVDDE